MDLDLGHEFLLGTRLSESGLIDDFGGRNTIVFKICEFVASSKATFTKEATSLILFETNVSVEPDNFFFYDDLLAILLISIALHYKRSFPFRN